MHLLDDVALLVGRMLMAALFLPSGLNKASHFTAFTATLSDKGFPNATTLGLLATLVEIAGPVALILGVASRLTAVLLIAFVLTATLISHVFWAEPEAANQAAQQIQFMKNLAIVGGLLFYYASGPGSIALERSSSAAT